MFIPASPALTLATVRALRSDKVRMAGPLFLLRTLPTLFRRPTGAPKLLSAAARPLVDGFIPLEISESELVYGLAGRFWQMSGGLDGAPRTAEQFATNSDPTLALAVWNFRADPAPMGTRLSTETRVHVGDERSRAKFARYWTFVRPGSGLIRRSMLAAVRRSVS